MPENRHMKLVIRVNSEKVDVLTPLASSSVTDALGYTPMDSTARGATNGVASLTSGKVPASELPSYVDDVIEGYFYNNAFYEDVSHTISITGETGKIYIDLSTDISYRWTGSAFHKISSDIDIDSSLSDVSENPVQNKVIKQALDGKQDAVNGKGLSTNDFTNDYKAGLDSGVTNSNFITKMDSQIAILKSISFKLGAKPTDWADIQEAVRAGDISKYYKVGDQFTISWNETDLLWDIVAIDVARPADSTKTHSLTLMPHTQISSTTMQFDAAEPTNPNSSRASYGNNRYSQSGIRQWLNSAANVGSWWTAQNEYDVAPTYATTMDGFMKGLPSDFLSVIGQTKIKVALNTVTDGGGYEEIIDRFYLASNTEVGLTNENNIAEEALFPYFDSADKRKKIRPGASGASTWWLRTPYASNSCGVRRVNSSGALVTGYAYYTGGVCPACNII